MRVFIDQTLQTQSKSRKRAPQACLSCRTRKVRCDVALRGRPCMNCSLDHEPCVVPERASRRKRSLLESAAAPEDAAAHDTLDDLSMSDVETHEQGAPSDLGGSLVRTDSHTEQTPELTQGTETTRHDSSSPPQTSLFSLLPINHPPARNSHPTEVFDILYTFYPFLGVEKISSLPPQDVNFLERQGCLRVPTRRFLDDFVQQYFMHVHPLLPLVEEDEFWELYHAETDGPPPRKRIPVLVFQSMLFASCNFVPQATIEALGYANIRAAKASLYRRAKLLYDLDAESSPLALAQASLLLSFCTALSNRDQKTWLSLAIQHAKAAGAHYYASPAHFPVHMDPERCREQNFLKKIWWCCVIRDRTLALLLRRPIQITRDHFDIDCSPPLEPEDLQHEFDRSKVYNYDVKRTLAGILAKLAQLHIILTDILQVVSPLDDCFVLNSAPESNEEACIQTCKRSLNEWYRSAVAQFPSLQKDQSSVARNEDQFGAVTLHTNLLCMYYYSSCVIVSHYEILFLNIPRATMTIGSPDTLNSNMGLSTIYESRQALQRAVSGVTECLKELTCLNLIKWLPISAVACTALPLLLHILDINLSAAAKESKDKSAKKSSIKQHQLNILIAAMRSYQPQYEGVDWVIKIVRHVVSLARLDNPSFSRTGECVIDWADILSLQPSFYLSLVLALDVGISKGRLPHQGDFPLGLRDLFMDGFNPLKRLVEAHRVVKSPQALNYATNIPMEISPRASESNSSPIVTDSSQSKSDGMQDRTMNKNESPAGSTTLGDGTKNSDVVEDGPSDALTALTPSELFGGAWNETHDIEMLARSIY